MSLVDVVLGLSVPVLNHWGYWVILFFAILEASPLFGLFVPGQLLVVLGGFFAKRGILDIGDVVFVAAFGAIFGDLVGYFLGRKYGYSFITRYGKYFLFKKEYFEKTKKLMFHHTGKTLIIGRFHSLTRAFAPFVAGATDVSFSKFIISNIVGGVSWAACFVLVGYVFGNSYDVASKYIGRFVVLALVLSVFIIYAYKFVNKRRQIFAKYNLYALILNIVSLFLFSKMLEDVVENELVTKLDFLINEKIVLLWSPLLNKIMIFVTNIASTTYLSLLSLILLGVLIYKKKWHNSILLIVTMIFGVFFELLIKLVIHRVRPINSLVPFGWSFLGGHYSFPSGHATMATIFFSVLLYSFKDDIKNKVLKNIFVITNIVLFLLVGFSRIYLNVHWFSDVIAGLALGTFLLTFFILLFKLIISLTTRTLSEIKTVLEKYLP